MSEDRAGASDDTGEHQAQRPRSAFDRDDGYSGQDYSREREAEQGRADTAEDRPRAKARADPPPPEDPDSFGVEPGRSKGALTGSGDTAE